MARSRPLHFVLLFAVSLAFGVAVSDAAYLTVVEDSTVADTVYVRIGAYYEPGDSCLDVAGCGYSSYRFVSVNPPPIDTSVNNSLVLRPAKLAKGVLYTIGGTYDTQDYFENCAMMGCPCDYRCGMSGSFPEIQHLAGGIVDTDPTTWGRIKALYR